LLNFNLDATNKLPMKNSKTELQLIQLIHHTPKKNYFIEEFSSKIIKAWINLSTFGKEDVELEELHGRMKPTPEKDLKMLNN
jgi:hypothetical protein